MVGICKDGKVGAHFESKIAERCLYVSLSIVDVRFADPRRGHKSWFLFANRRDPSNGFLFARIIFWPR